MKVRLSPPPPIFYLQMTKVVLQFNESFLLQKEAFIFLSLSQGMLQFLSNIGGGGVELMVPCHCRVVTGIGLFIVFEYKFFSHKLMEKGW